LYCVAELSNTFGKIKKNKKKLVTLPQSFMTVPVSSLEKRGGQVFGRSIYFVNNDTNMTLTWKTELPP
jgi:uncharacterized membrane protein YjjB (DUF3815 family)